MTDLLTIEIDGEITVSVADSTMGTVVQHYLGNAISIGDARAPADDD